MPSLNAKDLVRQFLLDNHDKWHWAEVIANTIGINAAYAQHLAATICKEAPPNGVYETCLKATKFGLDNTPSRHTRFFRYAVAVRSCDICDGSGICPGCDGEGRVANTECQACDGYGICEDCEGTGNIKAPSSSG